jgi:plasmid maintenance system antidote protein VapI
MADIERIKDLRARRAEQAAAMEVLDAEIARLIREAITEHGPTKLAKELGITRARVYQIRDGR